MSESFEFGCRPRVYISKFPFSFFENKPNPRGGKHHASSPSRGLTLLPRSKQHADQGALYTCNCNPQRRTICLPQVIVD